MQQRAVEDTTARFRKASGAPEAELASTRSELSEKVAASAETAASIQREPAATHPAFGTTTTTTTTCEGDSTKEDLAALRG